MIDVIILIALGFVIYALYPELNSFFKPSKED